MPSCNHGMSSRHCSLAGHHAQPHALPGQPLGGCPRRRVQLSHPSLACVRVLRGRHDLPVILQCVSPTGVLPARRPKGRCHKPKTQCQTAALLILNLYILNKPSRLEHFCNCEH
eukprot:1126256-Pelagomonas_calceolata.AAC.1